MANKIRKPAKPLKTRQGGMKARIRQLVIYAAREPMDHRAAAVFVATVPAARKNWLFLGTWQSGAPCLYTP
jgi:hypothetical protein